MNFNLRATLTLASEALCRFVTGSIKESCTCGAKSIGALSNLNLFTVALLLFACAPLVANAQLPDADGGSIRRGTLPRQWQTGGPKCMEVPDWQIHEYNPDLYILRQSGCTDFEKPFLYLLFGSERALLFDTGSLNGNLAPTIQLTIHHWLIRNHRQSIPLTVVHSHSHYDHNSGDADIHTSSDPAIPITLIPAEIEATKRFYAMPNYPDDITQVDLGGRVLDAIGIPGHTDVDIALYDRQTGILLTGDTIYPGRLFVDNFAAYQASVDRLVRFTEGKVIAHLLGAHVEQTRTPYLDYTFGTMYQPDEHVPELTRGDLLELQAGVHSLHGKAHRLAMPTFTIEPLGAGIDPQVYKDFDARFTANQKQQHANMWAQPASGCCCPIPRLPVEAPTTIPNTTSLQDKQSDCAAPDLR